ncbi:CRE-GLB-28 protein [Ditylenchus destructor]|uniref:CRE-GLB-28 protein n=1 Tax=Ditylenchus destructor TaxID=166010 RepID=A0AAD4N4C8_9BILA|nr:CRE-GLB-28 protein [Ditylenchus destructor]
MLMGQSNVFENNVEIYTDRQYWVPPTCTKRISPDCLLGVSGDANQKRHPRATMHAEVTETRSFNSDVCGASKHHLAPTRSLRRCRSASPGAVRAPLLTPELQNLIRKSWQRISKSLIGKSIYENMAQKCDIAQTFAGDVSAIGRHERYFADLVQSAVDNLADMEGALRPWLETIGKGHSGFAIKSKHWDAFGEALVAAISSWIGPGKTHRETTRAWRLLFSFISDRLGSSFQRNGMVRCPTPRIQLLTLVNGPNAPTTPP